VQVDLELELVDLAIAVVLAAGLEREQFGISRELLQLSQQFSYRRALSVARAARTEMQLEIAQRGQPASSFQVTSQIRPCRDRAVRQGSDDCEVP
jgi:hypothetical protein